ncbi:MAG: topoisomerase DNA-binding C4 zinc finger domain-containing protein [Prevotella sp.]|nr:topoisomerase DNA-binding C4 zinc finger domain-containing protein [Candidatus Equicola faecalis]
MKNVYQKIGKLLGEWRRKNGFSLYKIAKEGPGNVRYDSLKRVEKGDVVSSETLLCYVDFCYEHGFRIFDEIYNNITLQQCIVVENEQTCETKKESVEEVPAPSEEEEKAFEEEELTPPLDEEYAYAEISFDQKEVMNEHDQIAFIKHKRCPVCGKALRERNGRNGSFIGCSQYPKCNYTANGDFSQYSITENNKKGVIPK